MGHYASEMDPNFGRPSAREVMLSKIEDKTMRRLAEAVFAGYNSMAHMDNSNVRNTEATIELIDELVRKRIKEIVGMEPSAEERVFGAAFSIEGGKTSDKEHQAYLSDRLARVEAGETVWLARSLDDNFSVEATLFKEGKVAGTVQYNYETFSADAFGALFNEEQDGQLLCYQVTFDTAVSAVENHSNMA